MLFLWCMLMIFLSCCFLLNDVFVYMCVLMFSVFVWLDVDLFLCCFVLLCVIVVCLWCLCVWECRFCWIVVLFVDVCWCLMCVVCCEWVLRCVWRMKDIDCMNWVCLNDDGCGDVCVWMCERVEYNDYVGIVCFFVWCCCVCGGVCGVVDVVCECDVVWIDDVLWYGCVGVVVWVVCVGVEVEFGGGVRGGN